MEIRQRWYWKVNSDGSKTKTPYYPVTHEDAIVVSDGTSLERKFNNKADKTDLQTQISKEATDVANINAAIAAGVGTSTATILPAIGGDETSTTDGASVKGIIDYVANQNGWILTKLQSKEVFWTTYTSETVDGLIVCDSEGNILVKYEDLSLVDIDKDNHVITFK